MLLVSGTLRERSSMTTRMVYREAASPLALVAGIAVWLGISAVTGEREHGTRSPLTSSRQPAPCEKRSSSSTASARSITPDWLLLETNIGQHFLENPEFLGLMERYGVRIKTHRTQHNKWDPQLGIESLAVDFEVGRIRLPYGDVESRGQTLTLKAEATQYPNGRSDDLLMALWFLQGKLSEPAGSEAPCWPEGFSMGAAAAACP